MAGGPGIALEALGRYEVVLDYDALWNDVVASGVMGAVCTAGSLMLFIVLGIRLIINVYREGFSLRKWFLSYNGAFVVLAVFCTLPVYASVMNLMSSIMEWGTGEFYRREVWKFGRQVGYVMEGVWESHRDQVRWWNPKTWFASAEVLMLNLALHMMILVTQLLVNIGAALFVLAGIAGPVLAVASVADTGFLKKWLMLILSTAFAPVAVGAALCVLTGSMEGVVAGVGAHHQGSLLVVLLMLSSITVFTMFVLPVFGQFFGMGGVFAMPFRIISIFMAIVGLPHAAVVSFMAYKREKRR